MVVDGVGNYSSHVREPGQLVERVNPLARESESYYRFKGSTLQTLRKVWLQRDAFRVQAIVNDLRSASN